MDTPLACFAKGGVRQKKARSRSAEANSRPSRAFREQAKRHHPDAGGDAEKFRELVEAKERVLDDLAV